MSRNYSTRVNHGVPCSLRGKFDRKLGRRVLCGEIPGEPCPKCKRIDRQGGGQWVTKGGWQVWFMPDGWKPKVHFADEEQPERALCGSERGITLDAALVTCGSCTNQLRIRKFRVLMFLVAALIWAKTAGPLAPKEEA